MGWVDPWFWVGLGRDFSDSRGLGWVGSKNFENIFFQKFYKIEKYYIS